VQSTNHWNHKLTLYIDTPLGEVVASSVINIKYGSALKWAGAMDGPDFTVTGEATVADLGEGRFVFALLTGSPDGLQGLAREAYRDKYDAYRDQARNWDFTKWIRILTFQREERTVPAHAYPMIVTFDDIKDPASVREVKAEGFAASFGEGYALKRMTLQVTDEAVKFGDVENLLTWLPSIKGKIKPTDKRHAADILPEERLYTNDFIRISK